MNLPSRLLEDAVLFRCYKQTEHVSTHAHTTEDIHKKKFAHKRSLKIIKRMYESRIKTSKI